jgi:hypothetical protein
MRIVTPALAVIVLVTAGIAATIERREPAA